MPLPLACYADLQCHHSVVHGCRQLWTKTSLTLCRFALISAVVTTLYIPLGMGGLLPQGDRTVHDIKAFYNKTKHVSFEETGEPTRNDTPHRSRSILVPVTYGHRHGAPGDSPHRVPQARCSNCALNWCLSGWYLLNVNIPTGTSQKKGQRKTRQDQRFGNGRHVFLNSPSGRSFVLLRFTITSQPKRYATEPQTFVPDLIRAIASSEIHRCRY